MAVDARSTSSGSEDDEVWALLAGSAEPGEPKAVAEVETAEISGSALVASSDRDAAVRSDGSGAAEGSREAPQEEPSKPAGAAGAAREGPVTAAVLGDTPVAPAAAIGCASAARDAAAASPPGAPQTASCGCSGPSGTGKASQGKASSNSARGQRIPADILEDPELNAEMSSKLAKTHHFEVHRTVWRLRRSRAKHVGLQMPEGLHQWALALADIFTRFVPSVETITIMGDVTFGACCIDDLGAHAVGVDFIVHYGHSCIVPTDQTTVTTLYIHVEVEIDVGHLVETVRLNFKSDKCLAFMGTVQFTPGMMRAVEQLRAEAIEEGAAGSDAAAVSRVPQVKPLSVGETLGCTSPQVESDVDAVVFVCDGRFHLESAMIQNPHILGKLGFYRYDPFYRTLSRESFAHAEMHSQRRACIAAARGAKLVGLILSTLGRQGSSGVLEGVERLLVQQGVAHITVLLSDVSPERLARFDGVDAWVQVACPRLSIDWGDAYTTPMLTPYEAHVAFGDVTYKDVYPMDYYSNRGGPWSNYGAHQGHGGSLATKFQHLGRQRRPVKAVEYEEEKDEH